ncbi:MAG: MarR family winged helix-turn-helix transcriptional regulator [Albidovulum sp.]
MTENEEIAALLDRLTRLHGAQGRMAGLPDAQVSALGYLARANRFSRMPSAVAEYLATTRGTASQTLLALARKGLVEDAPAPGDRRSRIYSLTPAGRVVARAETPTGTGDGPAAPRDGDDRCEAEGPRIRDGLRLALAAMLRRTGGRTFGLCRTCRHHRSGEGDGGYCALLGVPLAPEEADQICADHAFA